MQTGPFQVTLNSGYEIPIIGMGTASVPQPPPEVLASILVDAIEIGYRHFDTASLYGSEEPLGRAVAEAIKREHIKGREDLFITSKLWCNDNHHDLILPALRKTLELDMDYVDLYLIHWPVRVKQEKVGFNFSKDGDILPFDVKGAWEAMEECSRLGLSKSIGVSNFGPKKLSQLLHHATILPAVNQVLMNVVWQQKELREFCKEKGIEVSAWSPLAANGQMWGSPAVMENPILHQIATAKGKTVAQVALRWLIQHGVIVIVKKL